MKAAVMYQGGEGPRYKDIDEPLVKQPGEILVQMKAVAIKNIDKSRARGEHYSSDSRGEAKVIGSDGVGLLPDGRRIFGIGRNGTMAEKALFDSNLTAPIPDELDDMTAAALPNAVIGSAMALRFRAALQTGETVLINGATGFTGKMAVQLARHYGAGKIIVTGRNDESLSSLLTLGADQIISLKQDDETFINQLRAIHAQMPIHVVIDYLWGKSAELILSALKGNGFFSPNTRYVSVGAMTGDAIQLSSEILRSIDLQLSGSGIGSWTKQQIGILFHEILPEVFQLSLEGKLKIDVEVVPIQKIADIWAMEHSAGKRLVVSI